MFEEGQHYRFMDQFRQQANFENADILTIDGMRVNYPDGWGLIRPSNTTPCLVLRFEANSEAALEEIKTKFRQEILKQDSSLKLPF
jgi:phosphomannomutase/phosphoglucomutase